MRCPNHPETNTGAGRPRGMTTLCRAYTSQSDAHAAVLRLLSVGVPGEDVRVLMGEPVRDGRDGVAGAFAGAAVAADGAVGTFAGEPAARAGGMGGFAGGADRMRAGAFADADRETVTSFPAGVAHMR